MTSPHLFNMTTNLVLGAPLHGLWSGGNVTTSAGTFPYSGTAPVDGYSFAISVPPAQTRTADEQTADSEYGVRWHPAVLAGSKMVYAGKQIMKSGADATWLWSPADGVVFKVSFTLDTYSTPSGYSVAIETFGAFGEAPSTVTTLTGTLDKSYADMSSPRSTVRLEDVYGRGEKALVGYSWLWGDSGYPYPQYKEIGRAELVGVVMVELSYVDSVVQATVTPIYSMDSDFCCMPTTQNGRLTGALHSYTVWQPANLAEYPSGYVEVPYQTGAGYPVANYSKEGAWSGDGWVCGVFFDENGAVKKAGVREGYSTTTSGTATGDASGALHYVASNTATGYVEWYVGNRVVKRLDASGSATMDFNKFLGVDNEFHWTKHFTTNMSFDDLHVTKDESTDSSTSTNSSYSLATALLPSFVGNARSLLCSTGDDFDRYYMLTHPSNGAWVLSAYQVNDLGQCVKSETLGVGTTKEVQVFDRSAYRTTNTNTTWLYGSFDKVTGQFALSNHLVCWV